MNELPKIPKGKRKPNKHERRDKSTHYKNIHDLNMNILYGYRPKGDKDSEKIKKPRGGSSIQEEK